MDAQIANAAGGRVNTIKYICGFGWVDIILAVPGRVAKMEFR